MMVIDMTAQLGSLLIGLNAMLIVAALALVADAWMTARRPTHLATLRTTETDTAIVRLSTRVPAQAGDPSRVTSVPEAA